MLAFMFRCPNTGYIVQSVADDPKPGEQPQAVCRSSDEGHDMLLLRLYHTRFSEQIETAATILSRW